MAETRLIEIPDFDFSGFYYPEILRALIQYQRLNVPEITDEADEEPFQQLLRCYALTAHLNNVLLDVTANETLLDTARLLESVRRHLALIDVQLEQAKPASAEIVLEFSKVFTVATEIVPLNSQFATVETDENPQVIYENNESITIQPTNTPTAVYAFTAGRVKINNNTFDGGDAVEIEGVSFEPGSEFAIGGTIEETLDNFIEAINTSSNDALAGLIYALKVATDEFTLIPLDQSVESITVAETDGATDNFTVSSGGFGVNKTGILSTDAVFTNLFDNSDIKPGDVIYVNHSDIMWNTLDFVFNTPGSGITFAVEYYDDSLEDAKPDSVTNLGSNLELDLTTLIGTSNRKGTVIRVVYSPSGASELLVSTWDGSKNIATTSGLLGQAIVDLDEQNYIVGTYWNEVSDTDDGSTGFTEDGALVYSLPQNQSQNWQTTTINGNDGFWIRLRVIDVSAPVNPNVDRLRIDTGLQFLIVPVTQGQTVFDDPLGSSNGAANQQFTATFRPIIEGTMQIDIDEGSGFQPWSQVENFLNSNSQSKHYTLTIQGDDTAIVTFGDGVAGKIPTPGVDNIRAIYRIGADLDGNVGAQTISVNKSGISFVSRLFNPRQASGWAPKEGSTEEDLARLKVEGPATLRTRGRAITTADIEFLATQYTSNAGSDLVARALAIEETFGVKTVELVVVGQSGNLLTEAQREELQDYFNGNKVLEVEPVLVTNHEVTVVNYTPRIINVTAEVVGGNEEQIKNAITALLNPEATFNDGVTKRWDFGAEVPTSVIIAQVFEVDPVNIKKVTLTDPAANIQLLTRELPLAGTVAVTVV